VPVTAGGFQVRRKHGSAANVRIYLGKNFTSASEPGTFQDIAVFSGSNLPGGVYVG
jgi:hypothetical protein